MSLRWFRLSSLACFGMASLVFFGCGKTTQPTSTTNRDRVVEDPWPNAVQQLRKSSDIQTCRQVLSELNSALSQVKTDFAKPELLPEESASQLAKDFRLSPKELNEIQSSGFSSLDSMYLAESMYLRDVAKTLQVEDMPALEQAKIAFDWVCRQVVLRPWFTVQADTGIVNPPVPVTYILKRGSGSGLERGYVFKALCQQLGIDAYFIGPPESKDRLATYQAPGQEKQFPYGPFCAVGVRDGNNLFLFEPHRGEVFPGGLDGKPATLAQLRKTPEMTQLWQDDLKSPWPFDKEQLSQATLFLTPPLSSLAQRMKLLEKQLNNDAGVKLWFDYPAQLLAAKSVAEGAEVSIWNPPEELSSMTRALAYFLPDTEGGFEASSSTSLYNRYQAALVPLRTLLQIPPELVLENAIRRLVSFSIGIYASSFQSQPSPREKIQRGQFADATQFLVGVRRNFTTASERQRNTNITRQNIIDFCAKANQLERDRSNAGFANPALEQQILKQIEDFWKKEQLIVERLVDTAVADPGIAEATYLLAICKHEQAERAGLQLAKAKQAFEKTNNAAFKGQFERAEQRSRDAWAEASDWWNNYLRWADTQEPTYPGRKDHAEKLAARANDLAK